MSTPPPAHIYISGPMRAYDGFNFPAFFEAEKHVRSLFPEADICNPAREDVVRFGLQQCLATDPTGLTAGRYLQGDGDHTFTESDLRDALGGDLAYICQHCDLLVTLPGWRDSKGALAEVATANALGVTVVSYGEPESRSEALDPDPSTEAWREVLRDRESQAQAAAVPDSGEVRQVSATGGEKGAKLAAFDQISPEVERLVAEHFGKGAKKYAAHNFRRGYAWSLSYSALRRHLADFWAGKERDTCSSSGHLGCLHVRNGENYVGEPDTCWNHTGSLHIVAVIWHAMVLTEFYLHHKEYDDRYVYTQEVH